MSDKKNPVLNKLIQFLDDAHANDVTVIHVGKQTTVTDYMIICSARSSRHVKAVAEQISEQMKAINMPSLSHTGFESGDWALIDFGDFVVHIMQPESRAFYNLEGLWGEQP